MSTSSKKFEDVNSYKSNSCRVMKKSELKTIHFQMN